MRRLLTLLCVASLSGTVFAQAEVQKLPDDRGPAKTVYSEQMLERGAVAGTGVMTPVYENFYDSGYGWVKNPNIPTGGPIPGAFMGDNCGMENGFASGGPVTGIQVSVFRSSGDLSLGQEKFVHVELWDGDPLGLVDTASGGYSGTKIAGSDADWSIGTMNGQYYLYHEYATPVDVPNGRVWVVHQSDACRLFWNLTQVKPTIGNDAPGDQFIGMEDVDGRTSGAGTCCHDDSACDNDDDPPGGCGQANEDACTDGDAEGEIWSWFGGPCTGDDATDGCANFMINIYAEATVVISLVPVSADQMPEASPSGDWSISGNEISMAAGDHPVWLEGYISDWDEFDAGVELKAWQWVLDSAGYSSGIQGTITPYHMACTTNADCRDAPGGIDGKSKCNDQFSGECNIAVINSDRADYVFNSPLIDEELKPIDWSTLDYRWASTISDGLPIPTWHEDKYAGLLVVYVPADAKGTFTLPIKPMLATNMLDQDNQFIGPLGVVPALVTVEVGQCCFGVGVYEEAGCIDDVTLAQCPQAGYCAGTCSDTMGACLTDDDCPAGTCSGACSDDTSISCWADSECTEGTCSHDASACHEDSDCGSVCEIYLNECFSWWDCSPGVCSSWDYYCVDDSDCPESGAVCGSAKGSCGTTWGPDWVECTDDSECTAYDPPVCDKPWDPEACVGLATDEERSCDGGAVCIAAAGDVCLADKDMVCPDSLDCVIQGSIVFNAGQDCSFECAQCTDADTADPMCADGDACTVDFCTADLICTHTAVTVPADNCCDYVPADLAADLGGLGVIASNIDYACDAGGNQGLACGDDGDCPDGKCDELNECTDNLCSDPDACAVGAACGVPSNPGVDAGTVCYDGEPCLTVYDECDGSGNCVGQDIISVACTSNALCEDITMGVGSCDTILGNCICVPPSLQFDWYPSDKPNGACYEVGEKILVDVIFSDLAQTANGAQFVVEYDSDCLVFNSIVPGGDPYVTELAEIVDEAAGMIFYAVGVDPFGGEGTVGTAALATISFTKIGVCESCNLCFGGENPMDTLLVDTAGQMIPGVTTFCSEYIFENDEITLDVPDDVVSNVDCDAVTAIVEWDPPTADGSCYDVNLVCVGEYPDSSDIPAGVVMNGGEFPIGTSTMTCTATSTVCGDSITDGWTVTVNDQTSLDVTIQVSPIIAADELVRCIKFELYSDTVQAPLIMEENILFGGIWDHIGHFTETIKVPDAGQWLCITARDQLHTLRACDWLVCGPDGVYTAIFKGDPAFGGNWLIGGNLDGWKKENPFASHDVIDILDFGQFVANYGATVDPNTPCGTQGPHADINGDGTVDALDFTFVSMNFLATSKECCGDVAAGSGGLTSIAVDQLREMGLGDLAVGDVNGDGVLDTSDMDAFLAGQKPVKGLRTRGVSSIR